MWLTIVVAVVCLGIGFAGGFWFYRSTMESERERGNLAKKISALPYILLDFMNNSRFNALTPDHKLEFITDFFRKELKALNVAAYTPTQVALDDFYERKKLNQKPGKPDTKEQAAS
jgi:hypothetical protein